MKKVAIYTGRFQPFHQGHYSAYQQLVEKFGEENVYIATSDPKETSERDPFDFHGKKEIMHSMFDIPSERIVQVKSPYSPKEILSKYDEKTTQFITAVGAKDGERLSGGKYFRKYDSEEKDVVPYSKGGYFVTVPNFKVDGSVMSATKIRDKLGNPSIKMQDKIDFFKKLYGKFDPAVFKMMAGGIESGLQKTKEREAQKKQQSTASKGEKQSSKQKVDREKLMKRIRNPQTRRDILVKTALNYDKEHPAYKLAKKMFQTGTTNEIFVPVLVENALINQYNSLVDQYVTGEAKKKECRIEPTDTYQDIERKCKKAYQRGVFYYPLVYALRTSKQDEPEDSPEPETPDTPEPTDSSEPTDTPTDTPSDTPADSSEAKSSDDDIDLILPRGKMQVLKAEDENYDRGLLVKLLDDGGYDMAYWYEKHVPYEIEVLIDGESVKKDAKIVRMKFHPQLEDMEEDISEAKSSTERVRKYYKRHPEKVKQYLRKTVKDRVARNRDRAKAIKKYGKEKMKNHDVHHPNGPQNGNWRLAKKDHGPDKKNEGLLGEGGAAGHMAHPYEDMELSFGEYKDMISKGLVGSLSDEAPMTEKLDGQNIAFTVIDGKIRFARNKGQVKNKGQNSLTVKGILDKFKGRGSIERAFVGAAKDLQQAISGLSSEELEKMFDNGSTYMSTEIILPDSQNVIPYDKSVLVFHGSIEYDEDGNKIATRPEDATIFNDQLKQTGQQKQKVFGIQGPHTISFSDETSDELEEKTIEYHKQIDKLRDDIGADDNTPVAEYYKQWWENEIKDELSKIGVEPDVDTLDGLVNRFAFDDKSMKARDIQDPKIRKWLSRYQKETFPQKQKQARAPFEMLFLRVGNDSLTRIQDFLSANNPAAVDELEKELDKVRDALKGEDLGDAAEKLEKEFERLNQLGIDKLVPSEGLVFVYNGKPYKFTGAFAPINQILGTFKFGTPAATQEPTAAPTTSASPEGDKEFIKKFYGERIRNPLTGKEITIQSALTYDKSHPAYKLALRFLQGKLGKKE